MTIKWIWTLFFCFLFTSSVTAEKLKDEIKTICASISSSEEFADSLVEKLRPLAKDPMDLPNRNTFVNLRRGKLHGLSTLHRKDAPIIICFDDESVLMLSLEAERLSAFYDWKYDSFFFDTTGTITVQPEEFRVFAKLVYQSSNKKQPLELTKLEVTKLENLNVKTTGSLSWLLNRLSSLVGYVLRSTLKEELEKNLKNEINEHLRTLTQWPKTNSK